MTANLTRTYCAAINPWQCDANDHLNVQFYSEFAHEATAHLLAQLGLGPQAQRRLGIEFLANHDVVRYLRELRSIDAVEVNSAVVALGDLDVRVYHEVRKCASGEVVATVLRRLGSSAAWPEAVRARLLAAQVDAPPGSHGRSVGRTPLPRLSLEQSSSLLEVGRVQVKLADCDEHDQLLPRALFARYSDAEPQLWEWLGLDRQGMTQRQEGSVIAEAAQDYLSPLHAGDLLVVRSGLAAVSAKSLTFAHYAFDGETGQLVARAETVSLKFDQTTRRIVGFEAEQVIELQARRLDALRA